MPTINAAKGRVGDYERVALNGPWSMEYHARRNECSITDASGAWVATVGSNCPTGHEHARLIAAAPDLLAALELARKELRLLNLTDDGSQRSNTAASSALARIDAALNQARGE